MKKFFVFILFFSAFLATAQENENFKIIYDDVEDVTTITHKNMEYSMGLYNLRDNFSGERENLRIYINDNVLILAAIYQYSSWGFIEKLTFLNDDGARCVVMIGSHKRDVLNGSAVREYLYKALTPESAAQLKEVLGGSNPVVVFTGERVRTDKLKIKPKVQAAMLETIAYFENMK